MADLLPSESDATSEQDGEPRVIGVDSEDSRDVLAALSSDTACDILTVLHEEPLTPSELADRTETSIQNIQYHLDNLDEAGLIQRADTRYSAKGNEMQVYAPADEPVLVFAGREEDTLQFKDALKRILGAVGILAGVSAAVQWAAETITVSGDGPRTGAPGGDEAVGGGQAVQPITDVVPPGVLFFAGGLVVILLVVAWWYWHR